MKRMVSFCLALVGLCCFSAAGFAVELKTESRLTEVVVYPDSALVTRTARLEVPVGESRVFFSDIIPSIDENTLKVSAAGSAQAKILGAQVKEEFLSEKPAERTRNLEKEIEALELEKRKLVDRHNIVMQEREFLSSLRFFSGEQLSKDLVTKVPSAKDVSELLNFVDGRTKENYAASLDTESGIKELDRKIAALRRELSSIAASQQSKRTVVVELEVLKAGSLEVGVSYLAAGASWRPVYDARADFGKSEAELICYGIVRQATGEDWEDVGVTLSTAQPNRSGRMPEVAPWLLNVYQPPHILAKRAKEDKGPRSYEEPSALEERFATYALSSKMSRLAEAPSIAAQFSYAAAQERGASVVYRIPRRATIKADGSEIKLPVFSQTLGARFRYSAYPKAVPLAFLGTRVANSRDLFLLAGRVNLFLDEGFVGASSIAQVAPQEEFDLYLGVDDSVKVKRETLERKLDDVLIGGIPAPNRRVTWKTKLTVENYKAKKIFLELFESMPVPEDERIKVRIEHVSMEPKNKDWKDKKGVWRWELELEPKAKREIVYTTIVEYPRGLRIEGLY